MEKELTSSRKIAGITAYITNAKSLGNAVIDETIHYFIIFVFTNIVIPILTLLGLFLLARYAAGIILKKPEPAAKTR